MIVDGSVDVLNIVCPLLFPLLLSCFDVWIKFPTWLSQKISYSLTAVFVTFSFGLSLTLIGVSSGEISANELLEVFTKQYQYLALVLVATYAVFLFQWSFAVSIQHVGVSVTYPVCITFALLSIQLLSHYGDAWLRKSIELGYPYVANVFNFLDLQAGNGAIAILGLFTASFSSLLGIGLCRYLAQGLWWHSADKTPLEQLMEDFTQETGHEADDEEDDDNITEDKPLLKKSKLKTQTSAECLITENDVYNITVKPTGSKAPRHRTNPTESSSQSFESAKSEFDVENVDAHVALELPTHVSRPRGITVTTDIDHQYSSEDVFKTFKRNYFMGICTSILSALFLAVTVTVSCSFIIIRTHYYLPNGEDSSSIDIKPYLWKSISLFAFVTGVVCLSYSLLILVSRFLWVILAKSIQNIWFRCCNPRNIVGHGTPIATIFDTQGTEYNRYSIFDLNNDNGSNASLSSDNVLWDTYLRRRNRGLLHFYFGRIVKKIKYAVGPGIITGLHLSMIWFTFIWIVFYTTRTNPLEIHDFAKVLAAGSDNVTAGAYYASFLAQLGMMLASLWWGLLYFQELHVTQELNLSEFSSSATGRIIVGCTPFGVSLVYLGFLICLTIGNVTASQNK